MVNRLRWVSLKLKHKYVERTAHALVHTIFTQINTIKLTIRKKYFVLELERFCQVKWIYLQIYWSPSKWWKFQIKITQAASFFWFDSLHKRKKVVIYLFCNLINGGFGHLHTQILMSQLQLTIIGIDFRQFMCSYNQCCVS